MSSQEKNHISGTEQQVAPQKPMSIDEYTKALRKEHEVARLRAGIAESLFKETLAMVQLGQLKAGQIGGPQLTKEQVEQKLSEEQEETTEVD